MDAKAQVRRHLKVRCRSTSRTHPAGTKTVDYQRIGALTCWFAASVRWQSLTACGRLADYLRTEPRQGEAMNRSTRAALRAIGELTYTFPTTGTHQLNRLRIPPNATRDTPRRVSVPKVGRQRATPADR